MDEQDRRSTRRFILQTPARVLVGPDRIPHEGVLMNLSQGGLFVAVPPVAQVGDVAFIQFDDATRKRCEATGKIVHVMPFGERDGYGIAFHVANDALMDFLHVLGSCPEAEWVTVLDKVDNVVIEIGTQA